MDKDQEIKLLRNLVMIQYILAKDLTSCTEFTDKQKEVLYDKVFLYMDMIAAHLAEHRLNIAASMNNEIMEWLGAHDEEAVKVIFENYHAMVDSDEFKELMKS